MRYRMVDVELSAPPDGLALAPEESGVGVLVRLRGRPLHFALHALAPGSRLTFDALWRLVGRPAATVALAAAIRDELAPPPPARRISLTVAVCTHARTAMLARCLEGLLALRGTPPRFDVLVVDNAAPDDTTERLVRTGPGVDYAREPRPGLDFARNRALTEARGEFVAFLDDDVVPDREWLTGFEEAVGENPDAAAVTGLVLPLELASSAQIRFERAGGFRRGFHKLRWHGDRAAGNALYPAGAGMFGAGCNMAFRREALVRLGGFDEALDTGPPLPGGGDLDAFHRVLRAGLPLVYEPRMLVFHSHRPDHRSLRRQYWSWGEGFMAYLAKTYGADAEMRPRLRGMTAWWAAYALRGLAGSLRAPAERPPDLALAELAGGVVGLAGSYGRSRRRIDRIRRAHG